MAERQTVFRWLRQNLAALIAGITLTAITVGTIDASTITVDAIVAGDASLGIDGTAIVGTSSGGASVTINTQGVQIATTAANDFVTIDAPGSNGQIELSSDTEGLGGDIRLSADDTLDINSDYQVNITATDVGGGIYFGTNNTYGFMNSSGVEFGMTTAAFNIDATDVNSELPIFAALIANGSTYQVPVRLGSITTNYTPGSTAEVAASTVVIPADAWNANGEGVLLTAWGTAAANTNSKTLRLRGGASGACLSGTVLGSADVNQALDTSWRATWRVHRWGTNTQQGYFELISSSGTAINKAVLNTGISAGLTETSIINLCLTAQNATTANDLTINGATWEWF